MLSSQSSSFHNFFLQLIVAGTTLMVFAEYFFYVKHCFCISRIFTNVKNIYFKKHFQKLSFFPISRFVFCFQKNQNEQFVSSYPL